MKIDIKEFEKNDWNHLHDVVFHATGKKSSQAELEKIFESLPEHLKFLATEWGMNDTVFRDDTCEYLENLNKN